MCLLFLLLKGKNSESVHLSYFNFVRQNRFSQLWMLFFSVFFQTSHRASFLCPNRNSDSLCSSGCHWNRVGYRPTFRDKFLRPKLVLSGFDKDNLRNYNVPAVGDVRRCNCGWNTDSHSLDANQVHEKLHFHFPVL